MFIILSNSNKLLRVVLCLKIGTINHLKHINAKAHVMSLWNHITRKLSRNWTT